MDKLLKVIFGIVFTFLFAFTGIGYAQLTQEMKIKGYMGLSELNAIYIVSVDVVDVSEGSSIDNISFTRTYLTSNITLNNSDPNAYITLEITMRNNTENMEAGFNDFITSSSTIGYTSDMYSNANQQGIHHMDKKFSPGTFRTFEVTIKYKDNNISNVSGVEDVLNIDFIPWSISGANAAFEDLLNENYDSLHSAMGTSNYYTSSYISNVEDASPSDREFVNNAFEGNMTTFIPNDNGELIETKMQIFIKRTNLDGNTETGDDKGREYILFMTSDLLENGGQDAIVYAYVYTKFADDEPYIMVGEMYEGKAEISGYGTSWWGGSNSGSFNTDTWYSTKEYHGVPKGTGNEDDDPNCGNLGYIVRAAIEQELYERP